MTNHPDTPAGARALLATESDLRGIASASVTSDPYVRGVWLVKARPADGGWRALVYLAGHGPPPSPQEDDFEVLDPA